VAVTFRGFFVAAGLLAACSPAAEPPPLDAPAPRPAVDAVRLAGPGAATPLLRHLADHFTTVDPGTAVRVEEPLGAAGAPGALKAGAIDAAIELLPAEMPPPPGAVALASTRVVAAGPGVGVRQISLDELARTVAGELDKWADGTPRRVFLRPDDDASQAALVAASPALADAVRRALAEGRWQVVHRDDALPELLRRTPGALAVTDEGLLRFRAAPVWQVAVVDEGRPVAPLLTLYVAPGAAPGERLRAFLAFLASDGRGLVRDLGYGDPP
jgi:hypothetical protein